MLKVISRMKKWVQGQKTGRLLRMSAGAYFVIGGAVFCHMAIKENYLGLNLYATGVFMTSLLWFLSSDGKGWKAGQEKGRRK